jgi:hypothetical protein
VVVSVCTNLKANKYGPLKVSGHKKRLTFLKRLDLQDEQNEYQGQ